MKSKMSNKNSLKQPSNYRIKDFIKTPPSSGSYYTHLLAHKQENVDNKEK